MKKTAATLMKALGEEQSTLSLSIVTDEEIRELNREHRGKDAATDVLSFPLWYPDEPGHDGERMLGDVIISLDTARRQAAQYDATLMAEVQRLLIHGLLHLLGHDHMQAEEAARMQAQERRLAQCIGMRWPYDD